MPDRWPTPRRSRREYTTDVCRLRVRCGAGHRSGRRRLGSWENYRALKPWPHKQAGDIRSSTERSWLSPDTAAPRWPWRAGSGCLQVRGTSRHRPRWPSAATTRPSPVHGRGSRLDPYPFCEARAALFGVPASPTTWRTTIPSRMSTITLTNSPWRTRVHRPPMVHRRPRDVADDVEPPRSHKSTIYPIGVLLSHWKPGG